MPKCCECRKGEHEDYDNHVSLCMVRDPESGKLILRGYICGEHFSAFRDDGYDVTETR